MRNRQIKPQDWLAAAAVHAGVVVCVAQVPHGARSIAAFSDAVKVALAELRILPALILIASKVTR